MNKSKRFCRFQGFEQSEKESCLATFLRFSVYGVLLSTFVIFLLAAMPSKIIMAADEFDSIYDKASLYFRQGKYEEALEQYKKANRMKQDSNLECLWGMAQTFSKLGAYKNTLQTCNRLIELSGDNIFFRAKAWNLRGNELSVAALADPGKTDLNKLREAEAAYREVLNLSSANMARYNLGITLIRMNRINEGVGELQAYVQSAEEEDVAEKARKIIQNPRRAIENYLPDFTITTADGEYISTDELKGKILLIDFWGAWCQPCVNAIPYLSDLAKKYKKESFVLLSVDVRDDEPKWREFIAKNKMNWMHARDGNNKITRLFQVNIFPSYILVDHDGVIQYRGKGSGMQTESEISNAVKKALKNLASSLDRSKGESLASYTPAVTAPIPTSSLKAGNAIPARGDLKDEIASPQNEGKKEYTFRIPKPVLEVTKTEPSSNPAGQPLTDRFAYRIQMRNWASLPDELFQSSKNLRACTSGAISPIGDFAPTRLEILIKNEQGQMLRGYCDPPRPEILQNLMLVLPNQPKPDKIYLELKDRLTGSLVQSDPVFVP